MKRHFKLGQYTRKPNNNSKHLYLIDFIKKIEGGRITLLNGEDKSQSH